MSGTDQNNTSAPTRLTPIAGDQPIGTDADGRPIAPTFYFFQMIQRILAYLGQPGSSGTAGGPATSGSSLTVSEQLTQLTQAVLTFSQAPGSEAAGLNGRVAALESALGNRPIFFPAAPTVAAPNAPGVSMALAETISYWGP
jgi:hypothetical protein